MCIGDNAKDDANKPRIMKRSRAGIISSSTDNAEENEPDEKRPAFRLQPPTLIHGKAKPVPKSEESNNGKNHFNIVVVFSQITLDNNLLF